MTIDTGRSRSTAIRLDSDDEAQPDPNDLINENDDGAPPLKRKRKSSHFLHLGTNSDDSADEPDASVMSPGKNTHEEDDDAAADSEHSVEVPTAAKRKKTSARDKTSSKTKSKNTKSKKSTKKVSKKK